MTPLATALGPPHTHECRDCLFLWVSFILLFSFLSRTPGIVVEVLSRQASIGAIHCSHWCIRKGILVSDHSESHAKKGTAPD
ncbi:hypothetical protein BDQ94DRAFT_141813 [Aspergillus welwitschiae]|uniref:Uncharacterized protein n=1 Tax=Aspergillus welwitschiae TaxID=1341132 RepID=A0A3F3Q644_9EURO|nr:hypothetical protein BDQ94DRAFT_141813 [Aspergillus welwitschiae]RDH34595.1 hypothetical protein BDQ94DRAFT_141813 [Aspergillus welwitschiae]